MSAELYAELAWLPQAAEDFTTQCRGVFETEGSLGLNIQALARHALDENQLIRLARLIAKAREKQLSLAPLVPFRVGIISNATSHFIVPALIASAARHGIALECSEADFDQVVQEALSPTSAINRAQPDAVLIALDHRGLPLRPCLGDAVAARETVEAALAHLALIRKGVADNSKAVCIVQTIARPPETILGNVDLAVPGTMRGLVDGANRGIAESISGNGDVLFDVAGLAE